MANTTENLGRDMLASFWRRTYGNLTANGAPDALAADALMLVWIEKRLAVEGPVALAKALTIVASGLVASATGAVMSDYLDNRQ